MTLVRFGSLKIGDVFAFLYYDALAQIYEKKSLSSAYKIYPGTLQRTGRFRPFSKSWMVIPIGNGGAQ